MSLTVKPVWYTWPDLHRRLLPRTAIASISIRASSSQRARTSTSVVAGQWPSIISR